MAREATHPTHDDEQVEVELGNKQLFSLLFIVFILLGVFFAMGYIMGRNSVPTAVAPARVENTDGASNAPINRPSAVEGKVAPDPAPQAPPTQPATDAAKPAEQTAAPKEEAPPSSAVVEPKPGQTYMQVSAVAKAEAEVLVEFLTKKGFKAIIAPGPSPEVFRVLVGPAGADGDLAKLRAGLEESGFKPIIRRY